MDPQCMAASLEKPGCAAGRLREKIADLERGLEAWAEVFDAHKVPPSVFRIALDIVKRDDARPFLYPPSRDVATLARFIIYIKNTGAPTGGDPAEPKPDHDEYPDCAICGGYGLIKHDTEPHTWEPCPSCGGRGWNGYDDGLNHHNRQE